jgi:pterin-4a-carbinolamine dehydratase
MIWRDRFQPSLSVLPTQLHKSALLACASGNQPQIRRQKLSGLPFPALCSCYQIQLQSVHDTCTRIAHCQSALDYIAAVGAVAEQSGHHPDLHLTEYRTIEVRLSTHARGGITINDFIVAAVWAEPSTCLPTPAVQEEAWHKMLLSPPPPLLLPAAAAAAAAAAVATATTGARRKSTRFKQNTAQSFWKKIPTWPPPTQTQRRGKQVARRQRLLTRARSNRKLDFRKI